MYILDYDEIVDFIPSTYTGCVHKGSYIYFWYFKGSWHRTEGPSIVYANPKVNQWHLLSNRIKNTSIILIVVYV